MKINVLVYPFSNSVNHPPYQFNFRNKFTSINLLRKFFIKDERGTSRW